MNHWPPMLDVEFDDDGEDAPLTIDEELGELPHDVLIEEFGLIAREVRYAD